MRSEAPPKLNVDFCNLVDEFTVWLSRLGYQPSTVQGRKRQLRYWLEWLEKRGVPGLNQVSQSDVEAYAKTLHDHVSAHTGRGYASRTIEARLSVLRLLDEYRIKYGQSPLLKGLPQVEHSERNVRRVLSQGEMNRLYEAVTGGANGMYLRCVLALYYGCGLRAGEGIRLQINEVDIKGGLLLVAKAKNYHQRYVPLSEGVKVDLENWLSEGRARYAFAKSGNVLLNRRGGAAVGSRLNEDLGKLCELAGVDRITLHSLRHSIATHLLEGGMPLVAIGRFLGHRSLKATQVYTHLLEELGR